MADNGGGSGKGRWPDMRSLRWPPEGVEARPAEPGASEAAAIPPFELAPDPRGTGAVVAVPIPETPPEIECLGDFPGAPVTAESRVPPPEATPAPAPVASAVPVPSAAADGPCQAALIVSELRALRGAVEALSVAITGIGGAGVRAAPGTGVVPVRAVSDHQARTEIQEYFLRHSGETLYPAQIADALNLPVLKVAELCEGLALRGQVSRNLVS